MQQRYKLKINVIHARAEDDIPWAQSNDTTLELCWFSSDDLKRTIISNKYVFTDFVVPRKRSV